MNNIAGPGITLLLRTQRPLPDVLADMRTKLRGIDSRLPLYGTGTLRDALDSLLAHRRVLVVLLGVFAGLALVLAAVGLYGVLAYDVSQRTREIGIRAAIGATRGQVLNLIIRQGLVRCGIGVVVGILGSLYLTRFLRSQLFDITSTDPISYVSVSLLLFVIAAVASLLPAWRASRVDPVDALRVE